MRNQYPAALSMRRAAFSLLVTWVLFMSGSVLAEKLYVMVEGAEVVSQPDPVFSETVQKLRLDETVEVVDPDASTTDDERVASRKYVKVKLADGTEGYILESALSARPSLARGGEAKPKASSGAESAGAGAMGSRVDATPGLRTATFDTPEGKISVHLPDDAYPSDTISGTVNLEPAGRTPEEQARNLGTLRGYVVEIENERAPAGERWWTVALPPASSKVVINILHPQDPAGPVARADMALAAGPAPEAPGGFVLPELGQTGRPIIISGPFDGRLGSSRLTIGEADALPLAESPRRGVFRSPVDVIGPVEIQLEEQGTTATGTFRNVALGLSAPRLDLRRGEQTTLTVEVRGLQGLDQQLSFDLTNRSPDVVDVEGGDVQAVLIQPEQVGAGGTYVWRRPLTGVRIGAFDIQADLHVPGPGSLLISTSTPGNCSLTNHFNVTITPVLGGQELAPVAYELGGAGKGRAGKPKTENDVRWPVADGDTVKLRISQPQGTCQCSVQAEGSVCTFTVDTLTAKLAPARGAKASVTPPVAVAGGGYESTLTVTKAGDIDVELEVSWRCSGNGTCKDSVTHRDKLKARFGRRPPPARGGNCSLTNHFNVTITPVLGGQELAPVAYELGGAGKGRAGKPKTENDVRWPVVVGDTVTLRISQPQGTCQCSVQAEGKVCTFTVDSLTAKLAPAHRRKASVTPPVAVAGGGYESTLTVTKAGDIDVELEVSWRCSGNGACKDSVTLRDKLKARFGR